MKAHRMGYVLYKGEIPHKLQVLHRCDTTSCVNPDHLYTGTHRDNMDDMVRRGRVASGAGEKNSGSKMTDVEVAEIREMYRTGSYSQYNLAYMFGVTQSYISLVVNNKLRTDT